MPPRQPRRARNQRWARYLKIAGDAGTIAMSLRDKPGPLDWIGVGLRAVGLALTVRDERRRAEARDPFRYFSDLASEEWTEVPQEFRRLVMDHVTDAAVDERYWDGMDKGTYLVRGTLGGEQVAWIIEGDTIIDGPYIITAREAETYRALGDRLWQTFGGPHLFFGSSGLALDPFTGNGIVATAQMKQLAARMKSFSDADVSRSYLLAGPPGTGKSMAIRWLVDHLALSSLRIDLATLARLHGSHGPSVTVSLETLLRLLRPRAMILDDLDRIGVTASLLAFLELAQRTCSVVIASANSVSKMMGAAVRPGRFDEIVRVDRLDPDVLRTLIANDTELFDRLAPLPAAYVVEFVKRQRVLGRARAVAELDELVERSAKITGAGDSDGD